MHAVESGYQAHIAIKCTFAIRRMPSSCQNLYKPSLTGAVVGGTKLDEHEYERRALTSIRNEANKGGNLWDRPLFDCFTLHSSL